MLFSTFLFMDKWMHIELFDFIQLQAITAVNIINWIVSIRSFYFLLV